MSDSAWSVSEAVQRLGHRDSTLKHINLTFKQYTDAELAELADCLLAHPDVITTLNLGNNRLTDETGVKLARYIAASSTVFGLNLSHNQISLGTYLALAAALRVNSSLQGLYLFGNQAVDQTRIDAAFVEALRLNPDRPARSMWQLYLYSNDFARLWDMACELGHPSMLQLLVHKVPISPTAESPANRSDHRSCQVA